MKPKQRLHKRCAMENLNDFITAYKRVEGLLAEKNKRVIDYEKTLAPLDGKKLQLCRVVRNFLQHESEEFCFPSKEMTAFLIATGDKIAGRDNIHGRVASDILVKVRPISIDCTIGEACKCVKPGMGISPVVDKEALYMGCLTTAMISRFIVADDDEKTLKDIELAKNIPIVSPDTDIDNIGTGISVVTSGGNYNDLYMGIVQKEDEWV